MLIVITTAVFLTYPMHWMDRFCWLLFALGIAIVLFLKLQISRFSFLTLYIIKTIWKVRLLTRWGLSMHGILFLWVIFCGQYLVIESIILTSITVCIMVHAIALVAIIRGKAAFYLRLHSIMSMLIIIVTGWSMFLIIPMMLLLLLSFYHHVIVAAVDRVVVNFCVYRTWQIAAIIIRWSTIHRILEMTMMGVTMLWTILMLVGHRHAISVS